MSFLSKLIQKGGKTPLVESDLGYSSITMKPKHLYANFEKEWNKQLKKDPKHRSLVTAIIDANGLGYWSVAMILNIVAIFLSFAPTLVLKYFVAEIENGAESVFFVLVLICR